MKKFIDYCSKNRWTILSTLCMFIVSMFGGGVMMADVTVVPSGSPQATPGQAGLPTQVPGEASTVSNAAEAGGELIQPDIDPLITKIASDESVIDTIKRRCKRQVQVDSFEVDHYMIDEKRVTAKVTKAVVKADSTKSFAVEMSAADAKLFYPYTTAMVKGVKGYESDGTTVSEKYLMLYCIQANKGEHPKFIAINGPKESPEDEDCGTPEIPLNSEIVLLGSAGYETQEQIAPSVVLPTPKRVYLQKQLCNSIVSDYFDSQKKRIPFQQAQVAEAILRSWRLENCRTAWVGIKSKIKVEAQDKNLGEQFVYFSEGIRWQILRTYDLQAGRISLNDLVYLMMFKFTGYNCSKKAIWLMGKELMANIQLIDVTRHKDISMVDSEVFGIKCKRLVSVFGEVELIHDPALDRLGFSKSGAILDEEGLVRYWRKNETTKREKVQGEEAQREIVMCIDALCLKGYSHIWVNGEETTSGIESTNVRITPLAALPESPTKDQIVILTAADSEKQAGTIWQWNGKSWDEYDGVMLGDTINV